MGTDERRHGGTGAPGHGGKQRPAAAGHGASAGLREGIGKALSVVRQVVGAPDYERYLEHHRRCHAGAAPLGRREFYAEFVTWRFGSGPTRCC